MSLAVLLNVYALTNREDAMPEGTRDTDVLIVGAGNAGLCAGIAALQEGAQRVHIMESAPRSQR